MHKLTKFYVSIATLSFIACSSNNILNNKDCYHIDWYHLGYSQAVKGNNLENLALMFPNCQSDLIIDQVAYEAGWEKGIIYYCQPQNAYTLGTQGKPYQRVCPLEKRSAFKKAWLKGLSRLCSLRNSYSLGLEGKPLSSWCQDKRALQSYKRGSAAYQQLTLLSSNYQDTRGQLKELNKKYYKMSRRIKSIKKYYQQRPFDPEMQCQIQKMTLASQHLAQEIQVLTTKTQGLKNEYIAFQNHVPPKQILPSPIRKKGRILR